MFLIAASAGIHFIYKRIRMCRAGCDINIAKFSDFFSFSVISDVQMYFYVQILLKKHV